MIKMKLHWQILIALLLAVLAGSLAGTESTLFLNALMVLIVPLLMSLILVGIAVRGSAMDSQSY